MNEISGGKQLASNGSWAEPRSSRTDPNHQNPVLIKSPYSVGDVSHDETCEECQSPLAVGVHDYTFQGTHSVIEAKTVPVQKCAGGCHGTWYPPFVMFDLEYQVLGVLRADHDESLAEAIEKDMGRLREDMKAQ